MSSCDYDPPEFAETSWPKARKEHVCCECGYIIPKGEKYERYSGKWDGRMGVYTTCERCADLRGSLVEYTCGCWTFTELFEAYWEHLRDSEVEGYEEVYARALDTHLNWGEQS